jgi:hypothetical protein
METIESMLDDHISFESQRDRMHLKDPDCGAPEIVRRTSMTGSLVSSVHAGSSQGSPHGSIDMDALPHVIPSSLEEGAKKKKKKKKDKEKDPTKLDEHDKNSSKKKKKKVKKKDLGAVGASAQSPDTTPHSKEPLSDRLRASDEYSESEEVMEDEPQFDDFCLERSESQQDPSAGPDHDGAVAVDNWDAFVIAPTPMNPQHDKEPPLNGDACKVQQSSKAQGKVMGRAFSDHSEHTIATVGSTASYPPPPPVTTIDADGCEDDVSTIGGGLSEYRGDMLHTILQRISGHNDQLALQTAMAFEKFLKQQQANAARLPDEDGSRGSNSSQLGSKDSSDGGESTANEENSFEAHLEKMEKMMGENGDDGDSFALSNDWDAGTFASFQDPVLASRPADQGVQITQPIQDDGWSKIRRNETYHRRLVSGDVSQPQQPAAAPRPRDLVAATQRNMVVQNHPQYPMAQLGLNHPNYPSPMRSLSAGPRPMGTTPQLAGNQHVAQLGLIRSPPVEQPGIGLPVQMMVPRQMGPHAQLIRPPQVRSGPPISSPMIRHHPARIRRPFNQQMISLSVEQRECVLQLKTKWEKRCQRGLNLFPDHWYIRFAKCSPGQPFDAKSAWTVMRKCDHRYVNLSILAMESQLLSRTLFPCPGLKSNVGYDSKSRFLLANCFYRKPFCVNNGC